jgi:hypothetical protein
MRRPLRNVNHGGRGMPRPYSREDKNTLTLPSPWRERGKTLSTDSFLNYSLQPSIHIKLAMRPVLPSRRYEKNRAASLTVHSPPP